MNTLEKAEIIASIRHIERLSKSRILIYNLEVPERMGRWIQAIAKRYALQTNLIMRTKWKWKLLA